MLEHVSNILRELFLILVWVPAERVALLAAPNKVLGLTVKDIQICLHQNGAQLPIHGNEDGML